MGVDALERLLLAGEPGGKLAPPGLAPCRHAQALNDIKVWQPDFIECTWKEDRLDAMRVASILDIPFITLDLEKEYKEGVIDYMIDEYRKGRTPNPDVMCNREVKFGAFMRFAKANDKDAYIATGHYASHDGESLLMSKDENKDQTYFLWTLK